MWVWNSSSYIIPQCPFRIGYQRTCEAIKHPGKQTRDVSF